MKDLEGGRQVKYDANCLEGAQRSSKNATNACLRLEDSLPWDSRESNLILLTFCLISKIH